MVPNQDQRPFLRCIPLYCQSSCCEQSEQLVFEPSLVCFCPLRMTGPTLLRNIHEWFSLGMCRLDFSTSWCTSSGFALMDDFATVESTCLCFVLLLDSSFVVKCDRCVVLDFTRLAPQSWSMRGVRMCHRSVL